MTSSHEKIRPSERSVNDISLDALADDLFGLNWRAIKTLGVSFVRPRRYALAAWTPDWENQYTPSFRLWFTLVAALLFFQFFWASADSAVISVYAQQLEASGIQLPDGVSFREASQYFARINFTVLPFASALGLFLLGFLYRAWGEAVSLVVRVRYVFAIVIPGTALSLPAFWFIGMAPTEFGHEVLLLSWLIPVFADSWTAYRGVFSDTPRGRRLLRSVLFALAALVTMLASAFLSSWVAGTWISWVHGTAVV